jgi:DNA-binding transcriptional MerR regulator
VPPTASGRPAAPPLDEHPSFPAGHPESRRPQRRGTDPLRFYGDRGLISCQRDTVDPRTYVPEAPRGIAFITIGQTIALSLAEIEDALALTVTIPRAANAGASDSLSARRRRASQFCNGLADAGAHHVLSDVRKPEIGRRQP